MLRKIIQQGIDHRKSEGLSRRDVADIMDRSYDWLGGFERFEHAPGGEVLIDYIYACGLEIVVRPRGGQPDIDDGGSLPA